MVSWPAIRKELVEERVEELMPSFPGARAKRIPKWVAEERAAEGTVRSLRSSWRSAQRRGTT